MGLILKPAVEPPRTPLITARRGTVARRMGCTERKKPNWCLNAKFVEAGSYFWHPQQINWFDDNDPEPNVIFEEFRVQSRFGMAVLSTRVAPASLLEPGSFLPARPTQAPGTRTWTSTTLTPIFQKNNQDHTRGPLGKRSESKENSF